MQVIGFKHSAFTPKGSSDEIRGYTLFLSYEQNGVEGLAVDRVFVTDRKAGDWYPVLGAEVEVLYNKYGKVESVALVEA